MQVCAALGRDGGDLFRQQVASINPDASMLKGPFNHECRAAVGMRAAWYDPAQWPEADRQRLLQEKYLTGPSYNVLNEAVLSPAELRVLAQRMAAFSELEESAAGGGGGNSGSDAAHADVQVAYG